MRSKAGVRILVIPFIVLSLMSVLLFAERIGLQSENQNNELNYLPASVKNQAIKELNSECLVLIDSSADRFIYINHTEDVLKQMRIGYDLVDVAKKRVPDLNEYRTVVIAFSDLDVLAEDIFKIFDFVENGGGLMLSCAPYPTTVFQVVKQKLGILEFGYNYVTVEGMEFVSDYMLGTKDYVYKWDEAWEASLAVILNNDCIVHIMSVGENPTPMIWECKYGNGRVVVNNHFVVDKASRGLTAAAYSLLEDVFAYPVINASVFFLDDFPAPVPQGDAKFIKDYGRTVDSFFTSIWWPDILELSEEYGYTYTGVVIEDYTDSTGPPFKRNDDIRNFIDFGGMLLNSGGEIGLHGYNHQPLVTESFDYKDEYNYNKWKSIDNMTLSMLELTEFTKELFPDVTPRVYVPPSNILSNEGRDVLTNKIPDINCIASLYLIEDIEFGQEFDVSDDGIINLPRIISGCLIDTYMEWVAMNELNMHYINSHFMHPDDVLDADRGAELGWEAMRDDFEAYLKWLYLSVPTIRNMNASEAAVAVEQYHFLTVKREKTENEYRLSLERFHESAYLFIRFNEGNPGKVTGGSLEKLRGNLYLLHAESPEVSIGLRP